MELWLYFRYLVSLFDEIELQMLWLRDLWAKETPVTIPRYMTFLQIMFGVLNSRGQCYTYARWISHHRRSNIYSLKKYISIRLVPDVVTSRN